MTYQLQRPRRLDIITYNVPRRGCRELGWAYPERRIYKCQKQLDIGYRDMKHKAPGSSAVRNPSSRFGSCFPYMSKLISPGAIILSTWENHSKTTWREGATNSLYRASVARVAIFGYSGNVQQVSDLYLRASRFTNTSGSTGEQ